MNMEKYSNIDIILPNLSGVLKDAIQSEVLEIKTVDRECSKFLKAYKEHPALAEAEFVVYSPYIQKRDHPFEHFVFLDRSGKSICHISGTEMELYGLLEVCSTLRPAEGFHPGPNERRNTKA